MKKTLLFFLIFFMFIMLSAVTTKKSIPPVSQVITLDFKRIAIRELLEFVADQLRYNIILSESITGYISLHLKQVTWMQALDALLDVSGLVKKIDHNMLYIGTPSNFVARQQNMQQAALLKLIKVCLHHIDAAQAYSLLKTQTDFLTPMAKVTCNSQENSLWIKESIENLPPVIDFLHHLDVPDKQIVIEAKIINLDENKKCELGFKFNSTNAKLSPEVTGLTGNDSNKFNFAIVSLAQNKILNLELDILEKTGHSQVVADPIIVTQNRKTATVEAGEDIPYQEKTTSGATSVTFKKAALGLKVTPTVLPDRRIILELEISQNKVLPISINGTPAIQTQELKTQVIIHGDETVILGGIYQTDSAKVKTQLPLIGNIPGIGALVNHNENQQVKRELLIFITPHIL